MALLGDLRRGGEHPAEAVHVGDEMIGGQHRHNGLRVLLAQVNRPQPDTGGSTLALWLDDEALRRQLRRLGRQGCDVLGTGDDEHVLRLEYGGNPVHRVLEHGTPSNQRERLFGAIPATDRPQSRPHPSGHNQCVESHVVLLSDVAVT